MTPVEMVDETRGDSTGGRALGLFLLPRSRPERVQTRAASRVRVALRNERVSWSGRWPTTAGVDVDGTPGGSGLSNMRDRLDAVGGSICHRGGRPKGTVRHGTRAPGRCSMTRAIAWWASPWSRRWASSRDTLLVSAYGSLLSTAPDGDPRLAVRRPRRARLLGARSRHRDDLSAPPDRLAAHDRRRDHVVVPGPGSPTPTGSSTRVARAPRRPAGSAACFALGLGGPFALSVLGVILPDGPRRRSSSPGAGDRSPGPRALGYALSLAGLLITPPAKIVSKADTTAGLAPGELLMSIGILLTAAALVCRGRQHGRPAATVPGRGAPAAALGRLGGRVRGDSPTAAILLDQSLSSDGSQSPVTSIPLYVSYVALIASIAISVLRFRLYDLDIIISRAVALACATAFVAVGAGARRGGGCRGPAPTARPRASASRWRSRRSCPWRSSRCGAGSCVWPTGWRTVAARSPTTPWPSSAAARARALPLMSCCRPSPRQPGSPARRWSRPYVSTCRTAPRRSPAWTPRAGGREVAGRLVQIPVADRAGEVGTIRVRLPATRNLRQHGCCATSPARPPWRSATCASKWPWARTSSSCTSRPRS